VFFTIQGKSLFAWLGFEIASFFIEVLCTEGIGVHSYDKWRFIVIHAEQSKGGV